MRKFLLTTVLILLLQSGVLAITDFTGVKTYTDEKGLWGLKDSAGQTLIEPEYKKLIALGTSSFIVQKNNRFGLIDYEGNILVPIKYSHVERLFGKYLKIGNGSKYGLYDETGKELLPVEYSSVDILFGGMFLTCKNYQYGVIDYTGKVILDNVFDDIYMPQPNIMHLTYMGKEYIIEQISGGNLVLPEDVREVKTNKNYIVTEIVENPVAGAGYSVVTGTDYFLKLFSSISPAHEATIDSLMLLQGADAIGIYFKLGWIPKYPFVFAKNYYTTLKNPNNGPLSGVKSSLKQKLSE